MRPLSAMEGLILSQPDAATSQTADDDFERTTAEAFAQVVAVEEVAEEDRIRQEEEWQAMAEASQNHSDAMDSDLPVGSMQ